MSGTPDSRTGAETKEFFRRRTEAGWEYFVDKYGPKIIAWGRCRGLAEHVAEDVCQTVLLELYEKWQKSCALWDPEKGSLRAWLRTVAHHAWQDIIKKTRRALGVPGNDEVLGNKEDRDLVEQFVQAELLEVAKEKTRARVTAKEWEVFGMRIFEGRSAKEVAEQVHLTVGVINNYTSKVRRVLKEELAQLEGPSQE